MQNRQLGPHFMGDPDLDAIVPIVNRWRPAVIKALGSAKWLLELYNQIDYSPKPKMVWRTWWQNHRGIPDSFEWFEDKPTSVAYSEWLQCVGTVNLEILRGQPDFYIEGFNEIPLSSRKFVEFEAYRTGKLNEMWGLKTAALCFSVGQDPPYDLLIDSGLLTMLAGTGGVIDGHYYFDGLGPQIWHGDAQSVSQTNRHLPHEPGWYLDIEKIYPPEMENTWLAFRMARHHAELKRHGFGSIQIINSEAGCDTCLDEKKETYRIYSKGKHGRGWRTWAPIWRELGWLEDKTAAELFAQMLFYAERQYRQYADFLLGNTVFTWGGRGDWEQFRIEPEVVDALLPMLDELDKEDDMTNEEMPDEPTVIIRPEPTENLPILDEHEVKFVSQVGNAIADDCGPICLEMWRGHGKNAKELYDLVPTVLAGEKWELRELELAMDAAGVPTTRYYFSDEENAIKELFLLLSKGRPVIPLVQYGIMRINGYDTPYPGYSAGHFINVIGMDTFKVYFYDPLHKTRVVSSMRIEKFMPAWKHWRYSCVTPNSRLSEFAIPKPLFKGRVMANGLRVRTLPDTELGQIIGYKYTGHVVNVYYEKTEDGNTWWNIGNGRWIAALHNGNEYAKRV
jgi:hypothetical protein